MGVSDAVGCLVALLRPRGVAVNGWAALPQAVSSGPGAQSPQTLSLNYCFSRGVL